MPGELQVFIAEGAEYGRNGAAVVALWPEVMWFPAPCHRHKVLSMSQLGAVQPPLAGSGLWRWSWAG